jgi:hypothetical protein
MNLPRQQQVAIGNALLKINLKSAKMEFSSQETRSMETRTKDFKGSIKQLRKYFLQRVKVKSLQIVDLVHFSHKTLYKRQPLT